MMMKKVCLFLALCVPLVQADTKVCFDGEHGVNLLKKQGDTFEFIMEESCYWGQEYSNTLTAISTPGNAEYSLMFGHPDSWYEESFSPNFTLNQSIYLNAIGTFSGAPVSSFTIDFKTGGGITTAGVMDFGGSVTALTLRASLTSGQNEQLAKGEIVTRTLLTGNGGIVTHNSPLTLTIDGLAGYVNRGVVASEEELKAGEYGVVYTDAADADTIALVVKSSEYESVPEPTTATLSLLVLAGLAARRRRASR